MTCPVGVFTKWSPTTTFFVWKDTTPHSSGWRRSMPHESWSLDEDTIKKKEQYVQYVQYTYTYE